MGVLEAIAEGGGLVVMAVSQFETGSSLLWGCQLQLVRGALCLVCLGGANTVSEVSPVSCRHARWCREPASAGQHRPGSVRGLDAHLVHS